MTELFSMHFTHVCLMFLQPCSSQSSRPNSPKYGSNEKTRMAECLWRNNVYNAKFSVEKRLQHGFFIDYEQVQ